MNTRQGGADACAGKPRGNVADDGHKHSIGIERGWAWQLGRDRAGRSGLAAYWYCLCHGHGGGSYVLWFTVFIYQ
jgi:hypothetical protein